MNASMKNPKDYAVLVINAHEKPERAVNAFTTYFFNKLKKLSNTKTPRCGLIDNLDQNSTNTWAINIESSSGVKRFVIKEFYLTPTTGLSTSSYFSWIFRAPFRAVTFMNHRLSEKWVKSNAVSKVILLIKAIPQVLLILFKTFIFFYFAGFFSAIVIRPLRKGSLIVFLLNILLIIFFVLLSTWKVILPPLLTLSSYFTNQLIILEPSAEVKFEFLFPVIAGLVFGSAITVLFTLIARIVRWVIPVNLNQEQTLRLMETPISYLLDPLYAAKLKDRFEHQIIEFNNDPSIQKIFVIADRTGVLLSYEVLSLICPEKTTKPICILTRNNFALAAFPASPKNSLWLLADHFDWERFSHTTPKNLSWYHFTTWPTEEYIIKLTSLSAHTIPQLFYQRRYFSLFKGANSALIERLMILMREQD